MIGENKDHCFIILSHADSDRKKLMLSGCIDNLKKSQLDIILISNYPDENELYKKVDYYVYLQCNPVLSIEEYEKYNISNCYFYDYESFKIDLVNPFTHDYAVFELFKCGVNFAKSLNKKYIHVINYDCIPNLDEVEREFINPLEHFDICYCVWDNSIDHLVSSYIISFKVNSFDKLINEIKNLDDYYRERNLGWQIEYILAEYIKKCQLKVYKSKFSGNGANRFSLLQQELNVGKICICADPDQNIYLFVDNKKEDILLNCVYLSFNSFIKVHSGSFVLQPLGKYIKGEKISIFHEGIKKFELYLNNNFEEFYRLNKLNFKNQINYSEIIKEAFKIGMTQHKDEVEKFVKMVIETGAKNILEIGTDRGGLFYLLCNITGEGGKKISIDMPHKKFGNDDYNIEQRNKLLESQPGEVYLINGDSHDWNSFNKLKEILSGEKLDLIFIDGDHSEEGAILDLQMYRNLAGPNAIIALHDIKDDQSHHIRGCYVDKAWERIEGDKHEIKNEQGWGGIGYIYANQKLKIKLDGVFKRDKKNILKNENENKYKINVNFIKGAYCEIQTNQKSKYEIKFLDDQNQLIYNNIVQENNYCKAFRQYFTKYRINIIDLKNNIKIYDDTFNCQNKRVYIHLDSSSLGDTIAWFPYVEEFRKLHNCQVICSTFWNSLFKEKYRKIEFVLPETIVNNLYAMYEIGIFYDVNKDACDYKTVPLQKIASNILGLEYGEIKPDIYVKNDKSVNKNNKKLIGISTASTCQSKFWNYSGAWQTMIDYFKSIDHEVVVLQKESTNLKNVIVPNCSDIHDTISWLTQCKMFLGLSSGVSWLAWALNIPVVMISGVTAPFNEFNCVRIIPHHDICSGCWHEFLFDKTDWNWCPKHKGTNRQHECTKTISPLTVITRIEKDGLLI